jgi:hypothetical protein
VEYAGCGGLIGVAISEAISVSASHKSCALSGVSIGSKSIRWLTAMLGTVMENSCVRAGIATELRESYYVTGLDRFRN